MSKENSNNYFIDWIEDIWEEVEVQFYGIMGALFFFVFIYLFFKPHWMSTFVDFFNYIK